MPEIITFTHPSMPGLIVHPADFQALERIRRVFPQEIHPLEKALYAWEGSEEILLGAPDAVGFPMMPGSATYQPFSLSVNPWVVTYSLHAFGRGDVGVPHSTPAFMVQASFWWTRLQTWTNGPLPDLFTAAIGAIETLWTSKAAQSNAKVFQRLNAGIRAA